MAPTSIMKSGLTSPIRAAAMRPRPRSVLKQRPTALPMSPSAGTATFSSLSLSAGPKSPHVHFPPSAVLASTYATHSPRTYDRTSIAVSPNPLALPSWGDRVYSPSVDAFKLSAAPPTPFRSFASLTHQLPSPLIADFADPRSPKPAPKEKNSNSVRFAPFPVTPVPRPRSKSLDKNSTFDAYPRSPYPSASFVVPSPKADTEGRQFGIDWPQDKKSALAAEASRSRSLVSNGRNKKNLSLGARGMRKAGAGNFISISSPLTQSQSFVPSSPDTSLSLKRSNKPAPLQLGGTPESEKLSDDFWRSMSIPDIAIDSAADSEAMFTAQEYPVPESAVLYEATQDAQLESATAPQVLYAGSDGVPLPCPSPLWSPGLPRRGAAAQKIRDSLTMSMMSPGVGGMRRFSGLSVQRKDITAPSPNDPFAAFPSFAAALEGSDAGLAYPKPVVSRG